MIFGLADRFNWRKGVFRFGAFEVKKFWLIIFRKLLSCHVHSKIFATDKIISWMRINAVILTPASIFEMALGC